MKLVSHKKAWSPSYQPQAQLATAPFYEDSLLLRQTHADCRAKRSINVQDQLVQLLKK